jgi:hypothetical protein
MGEGIWCTLSIFDQFNLLFLTATSGACWCYSRKAMTEIARIARIWRSRTPRAYHVLQGLIENGKTDPELRAARQSSELKF